MNVLYILALSNNGYAFETKFLNESKILPKVGEKVKNFYDEVFTFFDVSNLLDVDDTPLLMIDDVLTRVPRETIDAKIKDNIQKYFNLLYNSETIDLLEENNVFLEELIEKTKVHYDIPIIKLNKKSFDFKDYIATYNQLERFKCLSSQSPLFLTKLLAGCNTILGMNNKIPFSREALFYMTENEENEIFLSYTSAKSNLSDLIFKNYKMKKN